MESLESSLQIDNRNDVPVHQKTMRSESFSGVQPYRELNVDSRIIRGMEMSRYTPASYVSERMKAEQALSDGGKTVETRFSVNPQRQYERDVATVNNFIEPSIYNLIEYGGISVNVTAGLWLGGTFIHMLGEGLAQALGVTLQSVIGTSINSLFYSTAMFASFLPAVAIASLATLVLFGIAAIPALIRQDYEDAASLFRVGLFIATAPIAAPLALVAGGVGLLYKMFSLPRVIPSFARLKKAERRGY